MVFTNTVGCTASWAPCCRPCSRRCPRAGSTCGVQVHVAQLVAHEDLRAQRAQPVEVSARNRRRRLQREGGDAANHPLVVALGEEVSVTRLASRATVVATATARASHAVAVLSSTCTERAGRRPRRCARTWTPEAVSGKLSRYRDAVLVAAEAVRRLCSPLVCPQPQELNWQLLVGVHQRVAHERDTTRHERVALQRAARSPFWKDTVLA